MSWFISFFIAVVVSLITSEVVGLEETCVVVNFENGLEDFDDSIDQCGFASDLWEVGLYADIDIDPPHESSTTFIEPNGTACTSSYEFQMNALGNLEVTFYISTRAENEFLRVIVNEIRDTGNIVQANVGMYTLDAPGVNNHAWNTMTFPMGNTGTYTGFISIMGFKTPGSKILLDNFRYIPPEIEETHEDCAIYGQDTTDGTTTTTDYSDDTTITTDSSDGTTTTTDSSDGTTITTDSSDGTTTTTDSSDGTTTTTDYSDDTTTTTESSDDTTTTTDSSDDTTTTTDSGDGTTTESGEDTPTGPYTTTTETTLEPEDPNEKADSFWNPLTIIMTVALIIIPLVGISICLYEKSKRGPVNEPMFDPIVPRAKKV